MRRTKSLLLARLPTRPRRRLAVAVAVVVEMFQCCVTTVSPVSVEIIQTY